MKMRNIGGNRINRIAFRIDRNKHRGDFTGNRRIKFVKRIAHDLQFGRAYVRAIGIAEINQHIFPAEILFRAGLPVLIDKFKRPANCCNPRTGRRRLRSHHHQAIGQTNAENQRNRQNDHKCFLAHAITCSFCPGIAIALQPSG